MSLSLSRVSFLLVLGSAGLLGGAYAFEHLGGYQPCILCIWQRWPHGVVILMGVLALLPMVGTGSARGLVGIASLALFVGAGIAGFHVGVEQLWWEGTASCGSSSAPTNLEDLKAQIMSQPIVRCDEIAWSLAGISMAGWNGIASVSLGMLGFWGAFAASADR